MKHHSTPLEWRKGWKLYRRKIKTDSLGDVVPYFELSTPDFIGVSGTESGVAWQMGSIAQQRTDRGECTQSNAHGCLSDRKLALAPYDRVTIDNYPDIVWQITGIQMWMHHRTVLLEVVV